MEPRNAIVTGASHGIGQYIARALAARRMNLLLVARSEAELARLAGELGGAIKVSVAAVDLSSPLLLARMLLPGMLQRGYGRIVNVSSLAGHTSFPYTEAYAAAKDGLT